MTSLICSLSRVVKILPRYLMGSSIRHGYHIWNRKARCFSYGVARNILRSGSRCGKHVLWMNPSDIVARFLPRERLSRLEKSSTLIPIKADDSYPKNSVEGGVGLSRTEYSKTWFAEGC